MDLKKVEALLQPYLIEHELSLYSIEMVKEFGYLILRVSIDSKDGIDVDTLALCNEFLAVELDKIDSDMPEYMLEVCSPGAEKELRNLDEIKESISKYIHVEVEGMVYEGTLEEVSDLGIVVRYNAKGRFRKINIPHAEIKFIRLAVKI